MINLSSTHTQTLALAAGTLSGSGDDAGCAAEYTDPDPVDPNVARAAEMLIVPGASVGVPSLRERTTARGTNCAERATSTAYLRHESWFVLLDKSPKVQVDPWTIDDAVSCMRLGFRNV